MTYLRKMYNQKLGDSRSKLTLELQRLTDRIRSFESVNNKEAEMEIAQELIASCRIFVREHSSLFVQSSPQSKEY